MSSVYEYTLFKQKSGSGKLTSQRDGTYEGSWDNDLRHGAGKQIYSNGDIYEGGWEYNKVRNTKIY